ncbi:serine protease inhibitor 4, serpin-4-like isoform X4 [Acyrthosiphon pisum]|uniref:Serpin domain-containing protein n=1 Tax=Acyrthosiphon pisum TaxID=7029 RepID=A0A8R2B3G4_ACYPI|nr:serine protease inhibitor 4, serpin-4-like isoform X4 [Acyrthosiphon pisum]XP_008178944.1 serine protease inhibitor 4, serpin-4-like isoform X4 [Acyrthosiphon pisum]|eukprot:XP_008178943.1 PREDICTED: serine protease inhibitor 4, serpin-4-like isoform X4 [Acyrthosiphon pisum]
MSDDPTNMALNTNYENALSLANHDFSFSLYKELAKTENGNIFFSPFSIHVIMFMASMGAASKTFDEMINTIHLNETTHSMEGYRTLLEDLLSNNENLKMATGMFVDETFNVKKSFVENSMKYLKSSMEKKNFKDDPEKQRKYLNDWVLSKTNNKIKDLFPKDSITKDTALVLANAVHFQSSWVYKFKDAEDDSFYITPSNKVPVKMMTLVHDLQYYHDSDLKFAALELPYEHYAFKMIILLPDAKDGLKELENNLSKINLNDISNKMSQYHVTVKLPRFKLEQSLQLEDTLSNLGCPTMFTQAANFSNIVEHGDLHVSKVLHKAYVDVNEKGTEAAAATAVIMVMYSARYPIEPLKKVEFHADRPFVVAVASRNNDVLFMGRLSNP